MLAVCVFMTMSVSALAKDEVSQEIPELGKMVLSGPKEIRKTEINDIQYKAEYTMSKKVADTINKFKNTLNDENLKLGFNVKLDKKLEVLKKDNGDYEYEFLKNDLFVVDKVELEENADNNTLKVSCKLKEGWKDKEYAKGKKITLVGHCKIAEKNFTVGQSVKVTGDAWAKFNDKQKEFKDIGNVETKMMEGAAPAPGPSPGPNPGPSPGPNPEPAPDVNDGDAIAKLKVKIDSIKVKTKKGKKFLELKWSVKGDAKLKGFEIYRSLKKKSGYGKKPIAVTKKMVYTNAKLKKGKNYFYKIRGFAMVDGKKVYTKFSPVKGKKIK